MLSLYITHLEKRMEEATQALDDLGYKHLILGSGTIEAYFDDDIYPSFKTNPYFAYWCPAQGPHHFLKYTPGKKPLLVYYAPQDFWQQHTALKDPFWATCFEIIEVQEKAKLWSSLKEVSGAVFVGNEIKYAQAAEIKINCELLKARLNWHRKIKSAYEIFCLSEANRIAAQGHIIAKKLFLQGASEYEIHMHYLLALQIREEQLPYPAIVATNQNAAILHFQNKEFTPNADVLLLDAGAAFHNYASDITRTYVSAKCNAVFCELLRLTEQMQQELCSAIKPGICYAWLTQQCHLRIAAILEQIGLLNLKDHELAVNLGITRIFMPHSLGHFLGIQVHDVIGHQLDLCGNITTIAHRHKGQNASRLIDILKEDMVFTIEPGIYFIPMLLNRLKADLQTHNYCNWDLIDSLIPYGGIRIEDDILVTAEGYRNLTREHLA